MESSGGEEKLNGKCFHCAVEKQMQQKKNPRDLVSYERILIIDGSRLFTRVLRIIWHQQE